MPNYSWLMGSDPLSVEDLLGNQQGFLNQQMANQAQGQKAQFTPLAPAEEQSTLALLGNKALSGIGYAGSVIDKYTGGRAVRGALGGNLGELASVLPFSDALGITDPTKAVSGRDLTDQWGVTDKGADGIGSTLLGMGADILTSPATYLTPGGLTKAGEAASKIGALPKGLGARIGGIAGLDATQAAKAASVGINAADVTAQPLASLARFHIPFTDIGADLGTGAGAQAALKGAGDVASFLGHQTPLRHVVEPLQNIGHAVGNYGRALFDSSVGGATTDAGQKAGRQFTSDLARRQEQLRGVESGLIRDTQANGLLDRGDYIRAIGEGTIQAPGDPANQIVSQLRAPLDAADAEGAKLGFMANKLQDTEAGYLPRHSTGLDMDSRGFSGGKSPAYATDPSALGARLDEYKNIPGGTAKVNELAIDPDLSGINGRYGPKGTQPNGQAPTTPLQREALVRDRGFGWTQADEQAAAQAQATRAAGTPLTPAEEKLLAQKEQSVGLARKLEQLDPRHADTGQGIFANHVIDDTMATAGAKARRNAAGNAIHDMIADAAVPADRALPGYVRVDQALHQIGFTDPTAAAAQAEARIGARAGGPVSAVEHYVPPEVVKEANRFLTPFQTPDVLKPLSNAIDWITNLTKTAQTAIFPGFHSRNLFSGQFANAMMGAGDPRFSAANPLHYLAPMLDASKLIKGQTIEGLADGVPYFKQLGLSDQAATKMLGDLAYQYKVAGQGATRELAGAAQQTQQFLEKIPGMEPFDLGGTLKSAVPHSLEQANPLNVAGVNSNKDLFAPVVAARKVGGAVEDINLVSGFLGKLRQGFAPEEAGAMARAAHVDYSALTPFERGVMRKVMPFYGYTKGIVPFTLKNIAENPGGLAGQTAMEANHLQQQNKGDLIPDWMGQGLALPVGKEADGTQRFLSKIDTPVEATFDLLGRNVEDTGRNLLGLTNPLIKAPLEVATGKQFFTGRDLADLYPITGNTLADQAIMNSPLSRFFTTARTLTDPRKLADPLALGTNLLTGARLTDVDMNKERDLQARELISDTLRGQQGVGRYETLYPRQDAINSLTPQDVALLRLNATLDQRQKAEAEAKRKQLIGMPR